jgi:isoleucyl-tRNA synthetase
LHKKYLKLRWFRLQTNERETDLIDVWFDSGSIPTMALSFENKDKIDQNQDFPDFIAEGVDQTVVGFIPTLLELWFLIK